MRRMSPTAGGRSPRPPRRSCSAASRSIRPMRRPASGSSTRRRRRRRPWPPMGPSRPGCRDATGCITNAYPRFDPRSRRLLHSARSERFQSRPHRGFPACPRSFSPRPPAGGARPGAGVPIRLLEDPQTPINAGALRWLIPVAGIVAVLFAIYLARDVLGRDKGPQAMQDVGDMIREGADAFIRRQYVTIAVLAVVGAFVIGAVIAIFETQQVA